MLVQDMHYAEFAEDEVSLTNHSKRLPQTNTDVEAECSAACRDQGIRCK